ncbi:hypothetical protein HK105_207063 [Polyrhizophydium stewartii]|uniref:Uncharacterized protein n=1 Tax=Polyrhizophydium stewartii TaxID=2732419 RepID=A0ABR4N1Q4_9FUNG
MLNKLARAIVAGCQDLHANRSAASVLAHRAELVAAAIANQRSKVQTQAHDYNRAAAGSALRAIHLFMIKTASMNPMRQVLLTSKMANAIRGFDAQLVQQQQQMLQLAVRLQADAVSHGVLLDKSRLSALMELFMSGVEAKLSQQRHFYD